MLKILYSSLDDLLYDNYINENTDDAEVIQEVLNGNVNAFAILVNKYEKIVYNLAFFKLGNNEDAQDITQECFLRIYRTLKNYKKENAAFSTWIYIICRNLIYDFCKAVKHRKNVEISFYILDENGKFAECEIADISGEPLEIITREERIQKIRELIYTLPDNLRDMIVMRDINGLSYNEIAESLEIKTNTVKKRIYKARQKLKKYLN